MTQAQKREATRATITVKFRRVTYTIEPEKITIAAYEALRADDAYGFVSGVLGEEQFDTFKNANPLMSSLREMAEAIIKVMEGNSPASSSSSRSTARP